MGLVTELVPVGGHLERALEIAEALAALPPGHDARRPPRGDRGHRARRSRRASLWRPEQRAHAGDGLARRGSIRRRRGPRRGAGPGVSAGARHRGRGPAQVLRPARGRAWAVVQRRARRGVRAARPERRREDHHRRDPRGLPAALGRRGARARPGPAGARPRAPGARRDRAPELRLLPARDRARGGGALLEVLPEAARPARDDRARRARGEGGRAHEGAQRAASGAGSTSRWRSWAIPSWCSSTSPPPASTRGAAHRLGRGPTLKELGKTVLLTTHYLDEAQELADRVAIVKDGRMVAEGPPDQLGAGSGGYRVSYLSRGRRVEHQTDDPTELLHRLTARRARPRRAARGPRGDPPDARGGLPRADRGGGVSPVALAWEQFRFERKLFWRNPSARSSTSCCRCCCWC